MAATATAAQKYQLGSGFKVRPSSSTPILYGAAPTSNIGVFSSAGDLTSDENVPSVRERQGSQDIDELLGKAAEWRELHQHQKPKDGLLSKPGSLMALFGGHSAAKVVVLENEEKGLKREMHGSASWRAGDIDAGEGGGEMDIGDEQLPDLEERSVVVALAAAVKRAGSVGLLGSSMHHLAPDTTTLPVSYFRNTLDKASEDIDQYVSIAELSQRKPILIDRVTEEANVEPVMSSQCDIDDLLAVGTQEIAPGSPRPPRNARRPRAVSLAKLASTSSPALARLNSEDPNPSQQSQPKRRPRGYTSPSTQSPSRYLSEPSLLKKSERAMFTSSKLGQGSEDDIDWLVGVGEHSASAANLDKDGIVVANEPVAVGATKSAWTSLLSLSRLVSVHPANAQPVGESAITSPVAPTVGPAQFMSDQAVERPEPTTESSAGDLFDFTQYLRIGEILPDVMERITQVGDDGEPRDISAVLTLGIGLEHEGDANQDVQVDRVPLISADSVTGSKS
ncbi:hypothetical protein BJ742DRAFT_834854 [Cladochytrium replicatum]|nr:hypothetical protein BJ742DRAFT_834854 [Cladochytrium replicatum]